MHNRPQEEQWLSDAIKAKNIEGAEKLIEFIQEKTPQPNSATPSPRLDRIDETGRSFLFLSIEHHCKSIAEQLFELQKNNPLILFAATNNAQTLVWRAAKSDNPDMLRKLIDACKTQQDPNNNPVPIWSRATNKGNTPLHVAVDSKAKKTVNFLLETLKNNLSSAELIKKLNQTSLKGNTPLHLAMYAKHIPIAAKLAKAGCDWTVINNNGNSPFDYFCDNNASSQNVLLSKLEVCVIEKKEVIGENGLRKTIQKTYSDDTHQVQLLNLFQKKVLDAHANSKLSPVEKSTLEKHYHDLASMVSLKNLILAKASTDKKIHAALTNQKSMALPHGNDILLEEEEDEQDAASLTDEPLPDYQQISEDRGMLNQLIQDIDAFVSDLKNNPRISAGKKKLAVIIPILGWLVYGGVEGFFIYERFVTIPSLPCEHPHNDHCDDYRTGYYSEVGSFLRTFFFGMFGAGAALANTVASCIYLWNAERPISDSEWTEILARLQENVLEKLSELKADQTPANHPQIIVDLQTQFTALQNNHDRQAVITTFEQIATILKQIQTHLNTR